jgi:hypothetical protein
LDNDIALLRRQRQQHPGKRGGEPKSSFHLAPQLKPEFDVASLRS